jgi:hypothetical protein
MYLKQQRINGNMVSFVSINGVVGTSIKTYKGATVNWVVSKTGYKTQRGTEVVTTNTTKAITLEANPN